MREQLKAHIDKLFSGTVDSQAARDFHDELLQNTLDRFDEELTAGRSEQEAYRIAVLSLGNTEELLKPYYPKQRNTGAFRTVAIILYVTSVVPVILFGGIDAIPATFGVVLMICMIAVATMLLMLSGRTRPTREAEQARTLRAVGVALIIASAGAVVLGAGYEQVRALRILPVHGAVLGVCGMFCMIAGGIALLITAGQKDHARTVPQVPVVPAGEKPETAAPEMRPAIPKGLRIAGGILTAIYWIAVVILFFSISFTTGKWYYSWLVFVLAGGLYDILAGIVRLCCGLPGLERIIGGLVDIGAGVMFYHLTETTGYWMVTWLVFPIAGCLRGVVNGIFRLARTSGKENAA